jgi:hypothetical protein
MKSATFLETGNGQLVRARQVMAFLRGLLRRPELGADAELRERVRAYVDAFTGWDEPTRVEQYNLLHFDWDISGRDPAAVVARIGRALGAGAG